MNDDIISKVGPLMMRFCGLGIQMINDKVRNNFYDQLLESCENKKCIDVGGGSGILTLLALKHGAKHVTCFEMEVQVFEVLNDVINHCGLTDKVTLINKKFKSSDIEKYNLQDYDLIIHELFGNIIWNDLGWPIRSTFDKKIDIEIIPNLCINDFYFIEIDDDKIFKEEEFELYNKKIPKFEPGVLIDEKFVEYYNHCIEYFNTNKNDYDDVFIKKINFSDIIKKFNSDFSKKIKKYYSYSFDLNGDNYDEKIIKFELPLTEKPYLFFPIYRIGTDDQILRLDHSEKSWDHPGAFLIHSKNKNIFFELNMLNGTIKINDIVFSSGSPLWYF